MQFHHIHFNSRFLCLTLLATLCACSVFSCSRGDTASAAAPDDEDPAQASSPPVPLQEIWENSPVAITNPISQMTACNPLLDDLDVWNDVANFLFSKRGIEYGKALEEYKDAQQRGELLMVVMLEALDRLRDDHANKDAARRIRINQSLLNNMLEELEQQVNRVRAHREKNLETYRAALAGDGDAMVAVAREFDDTWLNADRGVYPCEECAAAWAWRAAKAGSAEGMVMWGIRLRSGWGVGADPARAAELFEMALLEGNDHAVELLDQVYFLESGINETRERDAYAAALRKAEGGEPRAMTLVGMMHLHGRGTTHDEEAAIAWFRRTAVAGDLAGMHQLGMMKDMRLGGDEVDHAQARKWIRKAADGGYPWGKYGVAVMYAQDDNHEEAVRWFKAAANAGSMSACGRLGRRHRTGEAVEQSEEQAAHWYRRGAELGSASDMGSYAFMYRFGLGVAQCYASAEKWYRRSIAAGFTNSVSQLGLMFLEMERNEEAVRLFRLGAAKEHPQSMYCLGLMYHRGVVVPQNSAEARRWFVKAARAGDVEAQQHLRNEGVSW